METGRESDEIRQIQFLSNIDYGRIHDIKKETPKVDLTLSSLMAAHPYNAEKLVLAGKQT